VRTADEIVEALGRVPAALVAGVGTGGTVSGAGRRLRALAVRRGEPPPHVVAVEPAVSPVLSGGAVRSSRIQGLNAGFVPANFDRSVVDEIATVTDEDAQAAKVRLAREEGLLVGISAGANVHVARAVAERLGTDEDVVTLLCDTGERYFSLDAAFAGGGR
jgi:cysteine synthase A